MRKPYLWLLMTASAAAVCLVGITWAYFTHAQKTKNSFLVGSNTIGITEEYIPPKKMETGDNLFKKRVQIKNTGTIPCFVRVFAEFSDQEVKAWSQLSPDGSVYYDAEAYPEYLPDGWIYLSEETDPLLGGYYYYIQSLDPGGKTIPLWEKIKTHFGTPEQVRDFDILVYGESVQTRDTQGVEWSGPDPWRQAWTEFLERR